MKLRVKLFVTVADAERLFVLAQVRESSTDSISLLQSPVSTLKVPAFTSKSPIETSVKPLAPS
jgi:hypothetical protein